MSLAGVASVASLYHFVIPSHIHQVTAASTDVGVLSQINEEFNNVACIAAFFKSARRESDATPADESVRDSLASGSTSEIGGAVGFIADRQLGSGFADSEASLKLEQVAIAPLLDLVTDSKRADFSSQSLMHFLKSDQGRQVARLRHIGCSFELVIFEEDTLALESHLLGHCSQRWKHSEAAMAAAAATLAAVELHLDGVIADEGVAVDVVA